MTSASMTLRSNYPALELAARELTVAVVDDAADFVALRAEWNELLSASRSDCLFLTWEWVHTWWVHLGQGKRLFLVTVRTEGRLVAIAPLTIRQAGVGPFAVPLLQFAGADNVGSDYLDFIVRSDCEAEARNTLTSFLASTGFSIQLLNVMERSAAAITMSDNLAGRGWECLEAPMYVCPFIDLSGETWDSYLGGLGPNHRYNFKRRLRNLGRDFTVRFARAESEEERREALRHVVSLHLLRWNGRRGGSNAFNDPRLLAFHEEMIALAGHRGWLRLFLLELDGKPAAAIYAFRYGRTFYFYQSGFDPAFEKYSVGLVTMGLTIQSALEEGSAEYDLLHGDETYKFLWAKEVRRLVRLELYPPGRTGRIHRNTTRLIARGKKLARRVFKTES